MSWLERIAGMRKALKELKFEKERTALALLALCFFGIVYFFVAMNPPEGWGPAFAALSICYLVAFVAVAAEWFWARWFASGLGWSGFMVGLMSLVMVGWIAPLVVYTGLHAIVVAALMGGKMAERYELQPAWRQRFAMDEYGVARLGKAVTRGSASLPTLIIWALAPRDGQGMALAPVLALILGVSGVVALLRMRTWGLLAVAGAGALVLVAPAVMPGLMLFSDPVVPSVGFWEVMSSPIAAGWALLAALPFARPAWRFLRAD